MSFSGAGDLRPMLVHEGTYGDTVRLIPQPRPWPPAPPPQPVQPLWRCSCEGCGAPLQRNDMQCSYCLRGTGVVINPPPALPIIPQPTPEYRAYRPKQPRPTIR